MAARNAIILAKMRVAEIPPYAYELGLAEEKQLSLADIVNTGSYSLGEFGYQSYRLQRLPNAKPGRVTRACAVFAKELVLKGKPLQYVPVAQLMMWARYLLDPRANLEEPTSSPGKGYLVVPDICESVHDWPKTEWQFAQYILSKHVSAGGGVILGELEEDNQALYSPEFLENVHHFKTAVIK